MCLFLAMQTGVLIRTINKPILPVTRTVVRDRRVRLVQRRRPTLNILSITRVLSTRTLNRMQATTTILNTATEVNNSQLASMGIQAVNVHARSCPSR